MIKNGVVKIAREDAGENISGAMNEPSLGEKIKGLKDIAHTLWQEIQALSPSEVTSLRHGLNFYAAVRQFEIELIRGALLQTGGSQTRAARLLGMNLTTLNTKIKRYKIPTDPDAIAYDQDKEIEH